MLGEPRHMHIPTVEPFPAPLAAVPWRDDHYDADRGEIMINLTERRARRAALALLDPELLDWTAPADCGPLRIAARYLPAAHPGQIGGDVYDVAWHGDEALMLVADVRGKGQRAARYAAAILGAFRSYPNAASADPLAVAASLDNAVSAMGGPEDFATAVLVTVDGSGQIVVVSCGHPPPLVVTDGVARPALTAPALPLGLGSAPIAIRQDFPRDSRLVLYTDGLSEARNPIGEYFPLLDQGPLFDSYHLEVALDALVGRVVSHVRGMPDDDLTVLVAEEALSV